MPPPRPTLAQNQKNKFEFNLDALRYLPRFFKRVQQSSPLLFWLNIAARLLSSLVPVAMLYVGKLIIDELLRLIDITGGDTTYLWQLVGIELALAISSDLLSRGISLTDGLLGDLYGNQSSVELIEKTHQVELQQLEDAEFYDKLERARQQTTGRVALMSNVLAQGEDLITVVSLIIGLVWFEPWLLVLLVLSIIPSFINEIRFSQSGYSLMRSWTAERRELDYLRYIGANDKTAKEVKLFGLAPFLAGRFSTLAHKYYLVNRSLAVRRASWGSLFNLLGIVAYYGAYVLIIARVLAGVITIGELTFLSGSFNRLRMRLQGMFSRFTRISESALYLRDYFDFLDIEPLQAAVHEQLPVPEQITEGFVFEEVSFRYPDTEANVLNKLNFHLRAGEKLALVGVNGAGKTTLIKLLLRFYQPTEGRILLDGKNIERYDKEAYQQLFGVIFQDFVRYEFTIGENIGVGRVEAMADAPRIARAAELSLAEEVVAGLPEKYEQRLGKRFVRGKELSGGQWQKIALARAYMKDADVMILDEPTSALDARAEYEAFQRFIALTKGKTSVIISHRFSTVRMADRILVLKDGSVLELGTHEELLAADQLYAELFRLQAAGYQ